MDEFHLVVQEEHNKNLAFHVPLAMKDFGRSNVRKPPTSPRSFGTECIKPGKQCYDKSQGRSRVRSASAGRDKKSELHARYWAFLFGNLQRAVDEIYQTCESDESVTQCKEVMMVLDTYSRDFRNLIDWFKIKWAYEATPPPQRPTSLAWEIRKSSPGKIQGLRTSESSLVEAVRRKIPFSDQYSVESSKASSSVNSGDESSVSDLASDKGKALVTNEENITDETVLEQIQEMKEDAITSVKVEEKLVPVTEESSFVEKKECEMVDEVCQTDREEDVDENGPKFRSVCLQTCPVLSGLEKNFAVSKIVKPLETKDETRLKQTLTGLKTSAVTAAKSPVKSSSTLGAQKPAWGAPVRTTPVKASTPRLAYSAVSRQPWGARPIPTTPSKQPVQSPVGKLTRCRTVGEVRMSSFSEAAVKNRKSSSQSHAASTVASGLRSICQKSIGAIPNTVKNPKLSVTPGQKHEEGMSFSNSSSSIHSSGSSCTVVTADFKRSLPPRNVADEDGWVKVRSRSRFSPANRLENLDTSLSRSASNLKRTPVAKTQAATRFHAPSSAKSLPSLAFNVSESEKPFEKRQIRSNVAKKKTVDTKGKGDKDNVPLPSNKNRKESRSFKKYIDTCSKDSDADNEKLTAVNIKCDQINGKSTEPSTPGTILALDKDLDSASEKCLNIESDGGDDEENKFDEEIKKNAETEERLQKEINELEQTEIDVETGDEETDGETTETTGTEDERESDRDVTPTNFKKPSPKKQYQYETLMQGLSWADHMDTLNELERLVVQNCSNEGMTPDEQLDTLERLEVFLARHPGRAMELHQKLSSPSRKRSIAETVKRFQARQAKALATREALQLEKAQKLRELLSKVNEVKAAKEKLIEERRQRLERKLERAAANRSQHLKEIMRKAHDEEEKLKEIAFINELEAQNKRHDFLALRQEQEDRLQGIHEERQRKQEEKAAKEAAVEERRKAIEAERQEKIEKMQERQRKRDEQADKKKQEKEKERQELAREKARDRTERLEALHAAQLEAQEELQKKIQLKQEESARRHEENMEQIRQKALELSILRCWDDITPRLVPYDTQKLCSLCNVLIGSEVHLLSHLRGRSHQEAVKTQWNGGELTKEDIERHNIKLIITAPADKVDPKVALDRERVRSFKKKSKKIRLRMAIKGEEFLKKTVLNEKEDSPAKIKLQKRLREIEKLTSSQGKGQWADNAVTALERAMGDIGRILGKKDPRDQSVFKNLRGFTIVRDILLLDMDIPAKINPYLPQRCFVTTCSTILAALIGSVSNCKFFLLSDCMVTILDLLQHRLSILLPDRKPPSGAPPSNILSHDPLANSAMKVTAQALSQLQDYIHKEGEEFHQRLRDVISYTVSVGIVDRLTRYCGQVRDPIDDEAPAARFLLSALELLATLTARCKNVRRGPEDTTQLLATLQVTELVGAVSIIYGMLLHQEAPPRNASSPPPILPAATVAVVFATMKLLRSVAELDLATFQNILGAEGVSLQFRHIASYLLWYCNHDREKELLHEVIAVVGFFAVKHRDNQMILQSGTMPTVLQQLCNLPFSYFCNPDQSALLFPTLLACCSDNEENKAILQQEISYSLLEDFLASDVAKGHPLVQLLSSRP